MFKYNHDRSIVENANDMFDSMIALVKDMSPQAVSPVKFSTTFISLYLQDGSLLVSPDAYYKALYDMCVKTLMYVKNQNKQGMLDAFTRSIKRAVEHQYFCITPKHRYQMFCELMYNMMSGFEVKTVTVVPLFLFMCCHISSNTLNQLV